jgi:two-component system, chemotaxis family, sensor kinase CheA
MNFDQPLQTFVVESRELLEDMESALLSIERAGFDPQPDTINAIFRAAHTIKGSAGLFGLDYIVSFTHVVESVLDCVRDGTVAIGDPLVMLLLACRDHMSALIDTVENGMSDPGEELTQRGEPLMAQLRTYLAPEEHKSGTKAVAIAEGEDRVERIDHRDVRDHWHLSLRFGREVLKNGMDPMSFIRYLERIGTIVGIVTLPDGLPDAEAMDPESCYLGFEIAFDSSADKATIEGVFEFVQDDSDISILPPHSHISEYVALINALPEETVRLGEILVRCGSITESEIAAALRMQADVVQNTQNAAPPLGEILIDKGSIHPPVVEAALARQKQISESKAQESRSIRVDADRLDQLINLIGELIIAGASANLVARRAHNSDLQEATSTISSLVEEVRDTALQLRMVKIGATFNRFQRVVHDVSREIGKDIELAVSGEDTELDKTVVEKIADPLMHMVRNAIDHGIESVEERAARGKPATGTVRLNAYHDSGSIVIEVGDDGGGLKRDRILAKAVERGLVEAGRSLSDNDIYGLIFEPGFSTAEAITNLSGRGVGMDVVKRNITALRGSVGITSEEGVGTTVSVRLPLTLAIIDGFLIGLGKSAFVIPLDMIEECVEFSAAPGRDYTNLRGQVLPFIRLRDIFDAQGTASRRESIVVVKYGGKRAGIVVDALLGEFQTVIKPLGKMFTQVKCISGSSILGSGEVALILDVPALFATIESRETQQWAA